MSSISISHFNKKILKTNNSWIPLVLRIGLGAVILVHGLQKLLGIFGGHGPVWTVNQWQEWWGMPPLITIIVIFGESIGMMALIIGMYTRIFATLLILIMIGAVHLVHLQHGFFMNWYGTAQGEGIEFHILVFSISLGLLISGGGRYSIDRYFFNRIK